MVKDLQHFATLRRLFRLMGVKRHQVAIPVVFSLVISVLDAVGLGLLAPLAQGVVAQDFSVVRDNRILNWFFEIFVGLGEPKPAVMFLLLASLIFVINALSVGFGYANMVYGRYLQGEFLFRLHTTVYERYFSFGKKFFDSASQGSIKKVLEYTTKIVEIVKIAQNTLTNAIRLVAHLVVLWWLSWQLFLFVLFVFPVLYALSKVIMRWVNKLWSQAKEVTLEIGREAFNMLSALPLVWSYSREAQAKRRYAAMNEQLRQVQVRAQILGDLTVILPRLLTLLSMFAVVIFIALVLVSENQRDLTVYIVFLYVASRTLPLFKVFNSFWVAISELEPPIMEVLKLFNNDSLQVVDGHRKFKGLEQSIVFRNLSFGYHPNQTVLKNISFEIPKGSFTAIVGPSGAGKSTIINILMRFYEVPRGRVLIDGTDINEFTAASLRSKIALVMQEPLLLNDTLHANITYGLSGTDKEKLLEAIDRAQLGMVVERLPKGLYSEVGDRGEQLSGGEKQRISLARALLKGSEILLLDEATSSLDSQTEKLIQEAIDEAAVGKTALVVAHRLSTIKKADQIVYIEKGLVKEYGSLDQLLAKKGHFFKQWQVQMEW